MRESDIVRTITIRHKTEGGQQAKADLQGMAAAQDKLAQSSENLGQVTETSARRQASQAKAFENMAMRADPARKAIEELNRAQKILQAGVDQNSARMDVANATLQTYVDKANKAIEARNKLTAAEREASMATRNRINEITGITAAANRNPLGRAEDIVAYGKELDRVREKFNPVFAVGQQYRRTVEEINSAVRAGALTEKERAAAMEVAKTTVQNQVHALREGAKAGRLMSGEIANLSFQLNDVVTGLALGQSPFMIMAQQGGQVYQILANSQGGVKGAIKEIGGLLGGLITPTRLFVGGVASLGAAALVVGNNWAEAGREIDRALTGIGRRSGETVSSINKFSLENSSLTGLSVSEARSVAIEFAKTGNLTASTLKGVGEAVKGYSILTGKDATEATKELAGALSGNLVEAALKVDSVYGSMNASTLESIRNLETQGKRAEAVQIILDRMASANQKAAEGQGFFSRLGTGVANLASNVFNGAPGSGVSPEESLGEATRRRDTAAASPSPLARQGLDKLNKQVEEAQRALDSINADRAVAQLDKLSTEAFKLGQAILPQIEAIARLDEALRKMQEAQTKGVAPSNSSGMIAVLQHQKSLQQDALQTTIRQAQVVGQLQREWGGVSAQTAIALTNLQGQLNVARAITGLEQQKAQYHATYNNLLAQGVASQEAMNIAAQGEQIARANATVSVEKQVQSLKDQNAMIRAAQNGTEAQTAAAIAYRNAIESGADSTAAAALRTETLKNHLLQAATAAGNMATNIQLGAVTGGEWMSAAEAEAAAKSDYKNPFAPDEMTQSGWFSRDPLKSLQASNIFGGAFGFETGASRVNSNWLNAMKNAEAQFLGGSSLKEDKIRGLQMQINALQPTLVDNPENIWQIRSLQRSMEDLINSVDENTAALNKVTLNPLYNGRDALKVGYMGAASGLDMMVRGGIPGVDSVPVHIMAQQGERVQVTPAGQVSNDNSRTSTTIVNQYFGGGSSMSRRSRRQALQGFNQSIAAGA